MSRGYGHEKGRWRTFGESAFFIPDSWYDNMYEKVFHGKNKKGKDTMNNRAHSTVVRSICLVAMGIVLAFAGIWLYGRYAAESEKNTLHVFNWSDYIDPEVIAEFESRNACRVCIDTFDDNESMLAKMQAGATGYDVIFPSSYVITVLKNGGMIRPLDMEKLPNVVSNFDHKFKNALHEDSFKYSVPYAFSMTGIAVRKDKMPDDRREELSLSWNLLAQDFLTGRTCIMNDIREILGVGLRMNGCSVNSTNEQEIATACKTMLGLKKNARRLDSVEYRIGLVNGSFHAAMAYSSDIFQVIQENPDTQILFFVPKEGSTASWDEMCITATSEKVDLAHKFIDFLYEAEIAAKNIEYVGSAIPNKAMEPLLSDEIKSNPLVNVPSETLDMVELIQDVGDSISVYNKEWDNFLSSH